MLLKSQSWFCIDRWTDLLVDLSELIEVYLIYAHPNFYTYSYFIQFNIHLFLKSIQKLKIAKVKLWQQGQHVMAAY